MIFSSLQWLPIGVTVSTNVLNDRIKNSFIIQAIDGPENTFLGYERTPEWPRKASKMTVAAKNPSRQYDGFLV
jgi:hypothetical protein